MGKQRATFEPDEIAVHCRPVLGLIVGATRLSLSSTSQLITMCGGFPIRPNLRTSSRSSITDLLTDEAIIARVGMKEMAKGQQLGLTCDGWSSCNEISVMAVAAHWVDESGTMKSACLGAFEVGDSHKV